MFDHQTFLFGKNAHASRAACRDGYPFDFDASLRYTRPKTGIDFWPAHDNADNFQQLGAVSGLMPQQDVLVWEQGYGSMTYGPIVSELPVNLQWQITVPGLNKQVNTNA